MPANTSRNESGVTESVASASMREESSGVVVRKPVESGQGCSVVHKNPDIPLKPPFTLKRNVP